MTKKTSKNKIAIALLILIMCIINAIVLVWVESNEPPLADNPNVDFVIWEDDDNYTIHIVGVFDSERVLNLQNVEVTLINGAIDVSHSLDYLEHSQYIWIPDPENITGYNRLHANISFHDNDRNNRLSLDDELVINKDIILEDTEMIAIYRPHGTEVFRAIFL